MGGVRLSRAWGVAVLAAVAAVSLPGVADAANLGCGDVVTVDTALAKDVRGCAGDGLVVNGDVTLDLNGHAIVGRGDGAGVRIDGGSTAVVKNGTIRGFGIGVAKVATTDLEISNVKVVSNGTGISAVDAGGQLSVRDSDILRNGANGITLFNTDSVIVERNKIAANGGWGIQVNPFAEPTLIAENVVNRNGGGIRVQEATTRIVANVVSHNDGDGIAVVDIPVIFFPYLIADNVANANGGYGITFTGLAVGPNGETVDGGGNSAKHNGAPTQCVSIVCA